MSKKVLVVDDEPSITELVGLILSEKGYEVSTANDGRQGLKQFESMKPDLVITDIVMPDMEGIEFIKVLAKKKKEIPVIVMSGNIMGRKFLKTARLFGARAELTKPFTPQELIEVVETILME